LVVSVAIPFVGHRNELIGSFVGVCSTSDTIDDETPATTATTSDDTARRRKRGPFYYLAQSAIWQSASSSAATDKECALSGLRDDALLPQAALDAIARCESSSLLEQNLWMCVEQSTAAAHYDANHGLLGVVYGRKTVTLAEPLSSARIRPRSIAGDSANHATQPLSDAIGAQTVVLNAGDLCFIPDGYWHSVVSDAQTIGVNFWFSSVASSLSLATPNIGMGITRRMLRLLLDRHILDELQSLAALSTTGYLFRCVIFSVFL
jgi:hypothetical protein